MSDVSGIPNIGFGYGGANFADMSNSAMNAQPNYSAQNNANLNYVASQQPSQSTLYGGGYFGAQPAYYAGVGAAYGRATGGFNAMGSVADTSVYGSGYGGGGFGDFTGTQPGLTSKVDFNGLNAQQQDYYNQHMAKYGYGPDADNSTLLGLRSGGGGAGVAAINSAASPGGGFASGGGGGGGAAQAYYQAHMAKYGFAPKRTTQHTRRYWRKVVAVVVEAAAAG